jgi:hypothetical protein
MGKANRHQTERVKYHKCEVCLKDIPIEYYFTTGDAITCTGCETEYTLLSKTPLELTMQAFSYRDNYYDETY